MSELSDIFSMIGNGNCGDVATSMDAQGLLSEQSIPIYEVFYLRLLLGDSLQLLVDNQQEFDMLKQLIVGCGAVGAAINIMGYDELTLLGIMAIYTPNTGMSIFVRPGRGDYGSASAEAVKGMLGLTGSIACPTPVPFKGPLEDMEDTLNMAQDMLLERINDSLDRYGIQIYHWEELPNLFYTIKDSGELSDMYQFRKISGASILL